MLLQTQNVQYVNSVTHAGKVVLFGTDPVGKIWYSIKQDGFEDSYLNTPPNERTGWEDWQELELPNETKDDASVIEKETKEFTYQDNASEYILRSRYRTQDETAVVPVQLVSTVEHLYVFRQSKQNTLLCDRYVLDGIANKLVRKLQVRFKRSGQRFKASEKMKQGVGGLKNVDSLDYRDANGISFYEPTTELTFINNLHQGWFSVIQLPTVEHAKYRWNIFAYNSQTQKIDLYSLRVSEEGLFDVYDYTIFEPKSEDDPTLLPQSIPGIIKRTLDLNVAVGNGISATKFYIQSSRETEAGTQLMRDTTKVMLALVTNDNNVAAINFTALGDGTLSQINETPTTEILRSNIREVLLPLNTLDNIKTIGIASPPPEGTITAFHRTIADGIPHVQVTSPEASMLKNGEEIIIQDTNHYNGHYTITKIDETTFEIDAPWVENGNSNNEIGIWQVVPPQEQAVVFDGIITGYEMTSTGKLRVTAENHGLENGDEVQVFDTASYDGNYPITKVDDQKFIINNLRWQTGEAVNLKIQSQKRRGIVFDGVGDYIEVPNYKGIAGINARTIEAWIKTTKDNAAIVTWGQNNRSKKWVFRVQDTNGKAGAIRAEVNGGYVVGNTVVNDGNWHHVACTFDDEDSANITDVKLYVDGKLETITAQLSCSLNTADGEVLRIGKDPWIEQYFLGQISDVRIWKVARTAQEIKNSMYLQLTGRETDLVGYWRLGGVAVDEENQRKVIDFSVNQNDGIVHGDCYVSAVTLKRQLGDGVTDAVQYSNKQLFAVTQQATYEETFEFQIDPISTNQIAFDGVGDRIVLNFNEPETEITHELWFKTSDPDVGILTLTEPGGAHDRVLYLKDGNMYTRVWNNEMIQTTGLNLADGQWHHVAHAIGSSVGGQKIYIDGKLAASGSKAQSDFDWQEQILLGYSKDNNNYFQGELKEFRVWKIARTEAQIQETLNQTLQGDEANLIGYWRLDAINNNAITNLVDDTSNHQVVGNPKVVEGNAFGSGQSIFNLTYWGQKTHRSQTKISFPGDVTEIKPATESGWYLASCRFTVPNEINLVRCFEISDVVGTWETLEIRKQRIRKISDVITEADYNDAVTLSSLGTPQGQLVDELETLQQKEVEEQTLLIAKKETEELIEFVKGSDAQRQVQIKAKENEIAAQQIKVDQALGKKNNYENKLNLKATLYSSTNYGGDSLKLGRGQHNLTRHYRYGYYNTWNDQTSSIKIPSGLKVSWYQHDDLSGSRNTGNRSSYSSLGSLDNEITIVKVEPDGWNPSEVQNILLPEAKRKWEIEKNTLAALKQELERLKSENNQHSLSELEEKLAAIIAKLKEVQTELNTVNTHILDTVKTTDNSSQRMPEIASNGDLVTTGAVLDFIHSASRVTTLETVEGMVQLSYFDRQGTLRQGVFDATADEVNSYFEQWLPDHPPVCLNCDSGDQIINLGEPGVLLDTNWTIEVNFVYPFPKTAEWNTLTKKTAGNRHILVKDGKYIGTEFDGTFYYCLIDSSLSNDVANAYDLHAQISQGWHHLVVVGKTIVEEGVTTLKTLFYIDGENIGECLVKNNSNIQHIGNSETGDEAFGKIAELRIWNIALKDAEILVNKQVYLTGNEPGLVAYYRLNEGSGTEARDHTGNGNNGAIVGENWWGNTKVLADPISQVMSFDGEGDYIDLPPLNIGEEMTIEVWIYNEDIYRKWSRILDFGNDFVTDNIMVAMNDTNGQIGVWIYEGSAYNNIWIKEFFPSNQWVHLAITIDKTGSVSIYWNGKFKGSRTVRSIPNINRSGHYIGKNNKNGRYFLGKMSDFRIWNVVRTPEEIQANMNQRLTGQETGLELYLPLNKLSAEGATTKVFDLANNHHGTVYGATLTTASPQFVKEYTEVINEPVTQVMNFDGSGDYISLPPRNLGGAMTIEAWVYNQDVKRSWPRIIDFGNGQSKENIVFCWFGTSGLLNLSTFNGAQELRFQTTEVFPQNQWVHIAATIDNEGNAKIYWNHVLKASGKINVPKNIARTNCYLGKSNWSDAYFKGKMAEFRVWSVARTQAEIQQNMNKRLTGKEAGLQIYLPLDNVQSGKVADLANNLQGTVHGNTSITNDSSFPVTREVASGEYVLNSFPLNQGIDNINANSFVTSVEYNTYDVNPITQKKSAMMRRMFAYPTEDGVQLILDKRIENLELLWIGNAQFAPTLLGYIEGAPPVPSENMNIDGDYQYNGATSVQLTTTEDVEFSWNRSQDAGLGGSAEVFLGVDSQSFAGFGVETQIESTKAGFKGTLDLSYQWLNESNVSSTSSLLTTDSLDLRGAPEVTPKFPHYGNRFIPKNVGYALVVSGLADVFITRLSRTQKMVGQEVRPVEDIPPDVNTITFLMNPAYVMNGSLDGLVGSSAANDEFYGHVPEMRAQYGSLYPASYFRLMEAYNLKQQIEKADKERLSYFENFNSNLVDEGSLNRQAGDGTPVQAITLNEGAETIDASGQELTEEEQQAQLDQIQAEGGAKLEDLQKQGNQRKQEINSRIDDIEQRTHALESFAGWQKNMENILVRSGKRNIVNTYVWDADGGLRVEEQSFANTTEHTIGGSFTMSGGMGYEGDISIFKVSGALTALVTTNLTQTMTKTQASSKGMELNVDLSGIEILGITDENDVPFQPGEKVDRFRMMSFYLENSTDNYLDFFKYVVDPEWLATNDEEARALRQVQSGRPNKTWRVLHRVTYVERPTLMGFGRDMRSLAEIASYSQARMAWLIPANATVLDEVKIVRDRVEYLEQENAKLQAKLDQIIDWMNNQ